jgi:hypothetical protein
MKCSDCGKEYPDYESICPQCNKPLTASPFDSLSTFSFDSGQSGTFSLDQSPPVPFTYSFDEGQTVLEEGGKVKKMKAAGEYMNINCPACMSLIYYGEDIKVCTKCDTAYHERCFPEAGCLSPACAPGRPALKVKDAPLLKTKEPPAMKTMDLPAAKSKEASHLDQQPPASAEKKTPTPVPARESALLVPPVLAIPVKESQLKGESRGASSMGIAAPGGPLNDYIGRTCPVCENRIFRGDEIYVCNNCDRAYHKFCFPQNGCQSPYCNEGKGVPKKFDHSEIQNHCGKCRNPVTLGTHRCTHCGALIDGAAEYTPPAEFSPSSAPSRDATLGWNSLVLALGSVFFLLIPCIGFLVSPICAISAIGKGKSAMADLTQKTMGKAGYYGGIIALCIYGLYMLGIFLSLSTRRH